MDDKAKLVEGPPLRTLLWLAWPAMIASYVNISYNFIDSLWLGKLGKEAFGAPFVSWPIVYLLISIGSGFLAGGLSIISQYHGAGEVEKTRRSAGGVLTLSIALSILLAYPPAFFAGPILSFMHVPFDVLPKAETYLRIILLGTPLAYIGMAFTMIAHALGDTRTPTILNVSSGLINIALDPILIFGLLGLPRMGVMGAAIATVVSRGFIALASIFLLFCSYDRIRLTTRDLGAPRFLLSKMKSVGIPLAVQRASNNLGIVLLVSIVSHFHSIVLAAYGIGIRVMELFQGFSNGLSRATSILVGNNIGAGKTDRAFQVSMVAYKLVALTFTISAIVVILGRHEVASMFIGEPEVVREGGRALLFFALSLPFYGIYYVSNGVSSGSGHTKIMAIISITRLWILRIGLAIVLGFLLHMSSTGIWIAIAISNIGGGIAAYIWVRDRSWIRGVI